MDAPVALWCKVLDRLDEAGVLQHLVLIGSWCIPCYGEYFAGVPYTTSIRTRDLDFLVPSPRHPMPRVNLPELLKDLGFVVDFRGEGYMKLDHPELIVEFLVPERGRGTDHPVSLPQLGVNAAALRFLDLLADRLIETKVAGHLIRLPHPAAFGLHKLLIAPRRIKDAKAIKDKEEAFRVLNALVAKGEMGQIRQIFQGIPRGWQRRIEQVLISQKQSELLEALK